ncbi:hypothetical protein PRIPAC_76554 [Pristionchus pacificus]|uniref:Uncharacterized protein n=1 Tax=Pristionchus pacificus TaxID=54126 RepID=A0A2A6C6F0_PRIPA|nr:hypothetical protein PRIPAC_76554 [Pristionchus pacificus]|eukprot:PDM73658.1 hypothetical protein PRIPAC_41014 [Pristionchus pacificus]
MGICSSAEVYPESSQSNSQPEKGGAPQPMLLLTEEEKGLLVKHFRATLIEQRPDIYHKTMLLCINASPKMNEIIACQQYCMRDLTQWPKLNKIFTLPTSSTASNRTFSTYGDSIDAQMHRLTMDSAEEKAGFLKAMSMLNEFIVDALYTSFNEEKKLRVSAASTPAPV